MLENGLLQKINVKIETKLSESPDYPVAQSPAEQPIISSQNSPLESRPLPQNSAQARACKIITKLLSATLAELNKIWYGLEPDSAYQDQIQSLAIETTQPPFSREKIETFISALAEWKQYEVTRVATWIEWARSEADKWDVNKCSCCAQRVELLTQSGVSREKAIQIAFCENWN